MVGNISNYSSFDVLRLFLAIDSPVSRGELMEKLDLGEGTVRSILDVLKGKKLIRSTKRGHFLSLKGREIFDNINEKISIKKVSLKKIYPKNKKIALLLKNKKNVSISYKHRDIAVKNGAEGALIFVYDQGLVMPGAEKYSYDELDGLFSYEKDDVLMVTFADSYRWAENAALAVAMELEPKLKVI